MATMNNVIKIAVLFTALCLFHLSGCTKSTELKETAVDQEQDSEYWLARKNDPLSSLDLSEKAFAELQERGFRVVGHLLMMNHVELLRTISGPRQLIFEEVKARKIPSGMVIQDIPEFDYNPPVAAEVVKEDRSIFKHDESRSLIDVLNSMMNVLSSVQPSSEDQLMPAAEKSDIEKLEKALEMPVPEELVTLLQFANGTQEGFLPHQYGLLSVDHIIETRQIHIDNIQYDENFYRISDPKELDPAIQPTAFHEQWIPFASVDRDTLYIDLVPKDKGFDGQIITSDGSFTKWLSKDLVQFFGQIDAGLKAGWYYSPEPGDFTSILSKGKAWYQMTGDK